MDDGLRARVGELGGRGVELFFAISGILICFKLAESKIQDGMISLRSFYIRRFFRLVPAASVYLAAVASLAAAGSLPASLGEILAAVFCYRNYHYAVNVGEGYYTAHFWSLSVEEHFYLLAPWLIAAGLGRAKFVLPAAAVSVAAWRAVEFRMGISASVFPRLTFNLLRTDLCLDHLIWSAWFGLLLAPPPQPTPYRIPGETWIQICAAGSRDGGSLLRASCPQDMDRGGHSSAPVRDDPLVRGAVGTPPRGQASNLDGSIVLQSLSVAAALPDDRCCTGSRMAVEPSAEFSVRHPRGIRRRLLFVLLHRAACAAVGPRSAAALDRTGPADSRRERGALGPAVGTVSGRREHMKTVSTGWPTNVEESKADWKWTS